MSIETGGGGGATGMVLHQLLQDGVNGKGGGAGAMAGGTCDGSAGGDGIVIIRYKFQ